MSVKARRVRPALLPIDPYVGILLENIAEGKQVFTFKVSETIFNQGDRADSIFFIQSGKVKISVISPAGKEAVLVVIGPPNCFGEGSLVRQQLRVSTATALESSTIFRVETSAMMKALNTESELSEKFIAALLLRNIELEEDLCDQLFNQSEKRLARVLVKLARLQADQALHNARIAHVSHETLAEMVGTTRSRITHFMNKFRTMGLIDYDNGGVTVRIESLTDVLLHD
jgi:CRP/FNR family cyclic AMP-dependent transcriptional regulator